MSIPGNWRERHFRYQLGSSVDGSGRMRAPLNVEAHLMKKTEVTHEPEHQNLELAFPVVALFQQLEHA